MTSEIGSRYCKVQIYRVMEIGSHWKLGHEKKIFLQKRDIGDEIAIKKTYSCYSKLILTSSGLPDAKKNFWIGTQHININIIKTTSPVGKNFIIVFRL